MRNEEFESQPLVCLDVIPKLDCVDSRVCLLPYITYVRRVLSCYY